MTRSAAAARCALAVLGALIAAAACAVLARGATATARGQRLDQLVLSGAEHDPSAVTRTLLPFLNDLTVPVGVALLVAAAVCAVARRRPGVLAQIVVTVLGAVATTQLLKHVLIQRTALAPGVDVTPNSFPSGHTSFAAAAAVAATIALPPRVRPIAAILGGAWAALAGFGTVAEQWHRPSDVIGALLVVTAWTLAVQAAASALAAARAVDPAPDPDPAMDEPTPRPVVPAHPLPTATTVVLALLAAAGLILGALLLASIPTPLDLTSTADQSRAYAGSAATIAGCTAMMVAGLLVSHVPSVPRHADPMRVR